MSKVDKFWRSFEKNLKTLKYGDEYQLNFTSDPTLDEGGLYFNMVSKKELAKKEEIKKKAEKKKQESKKRRNQGIESSEGYSTFMRSDVEDCECHKTFKKDFPFSMKELRAMVHNMKYLKTIVQESKELTNMLMIHAEQSTSNTH
uniref:BESS domain-containing protein n=1 Tax=Parastrongyloides trichosuri TaxID=131310 RepID=A0A0N4ZNX1_PARTI